MRLGNGNSTDTSTGNGNVHVNGTGTGAGTGGVTGSGLGTASATGTAASAGADAGGLRRGPLVVRLRNWIGDVALGLPALQLLADNGHDLRLVARGGWAPALLAGHGWPVSVQPAGWAAKVAQLRGLRRAARLADPGFDRRDNALLLPVSFSSALEMRLAGLRAVGVAREGRSPLLSRALPWATQGHELERYWDVACRFLRLRLPAPREIGLKVAPDKARAAAERLAAQGVAGRFLVICPFAKGQAATEDKADKKWPGFAEFARQVPARLGLPVVVHPGPGEDAEARALYPTATLIDGADLGVYLGVLQRATLVVANDTGPGHLAAALGRPLISVLGSADAARWAPWGPRVEVLQVPRRGTEVGWPDVGAALALARSMLDRDAAGTPAPR